MSDDVPPAEAATARTEDEAEAAEEGGMRASSEPHDSAESTLARARPDSMSAAV